MAARRFLGQGVDLGGQKAVNGADGVSATDLVTKQQLDAAVTSKDWKDAVRVATTGNGTFASAFANGQTVDGVVLATGDRILLKDQSTGSQNGIYVVQASGSPVRATDADASAEVTSGMAVLVTNGTVNGDTGWVLTTADPITLGTTSLTFTKLPGLSSAYTTVQSGGSGVTQRATLNASTGLTATDNSGASRTDLAIDTSVVVRKYAADIGDGSTTSIVVTHNLGTLDVQVEVYDKTTPFARVEPDIQHTTTNTITLVFATAPTSAQFRVVVHG